MSLSYRRLATALLAASLAVVPVGSAVADPTEPTTPPSSSDDSATSSSEPDGTTEPAPAEAAAEQPAEPVAAPPPEDAPAAEVPAPDTGAALMTTDAVPQALAADLSDPAGAAADWLVSQLTGGDHFVGSYPCGTDTCTFEDYGLTADGVLALVAAGDHSAEVTAMTDYLEANADPYVSSFGSTYAGSIAKLLLIAAVTERDPADFGGHDLVAELEARRGTVEPGRYSDDSDCEIPADCDNSNIIVQSLAILALERAGEAVPADAVAFLVDQQCTDGGFQAQFPADGGTCTSDPDSTGFALQALAAAGGVGAAGDAGTAARAWLRENRRGDGSWASEGTVNATALASGGLLVVGDDVASSVGWLEGAQLDDGSLPVNPVNPGDAGGDSRATTQAVLSLAGESLLSVGPGGTDRVTLVPTPAVDPGLLAPPVTSPAAPVVAAPVGDAVQAADRGAPTGALANTGASPVQPTIVALTLLVLGAALVRLARQPVPQVARHQGGVLR